MFDWKALVALAGDWEKQVGASGNHEALLRSALTRIYFGVYCYSRNYARDWLGFSAKENADDHGRLRAHLKAKKRMADSDRLDRLRQWRNECDYLDELTVNLSDTVKLH
jgi:hypothetical protein